MNAAAGDADGDGDLDLALAMEFEPKVLLLNDGAARFRDASAQLPRTIHDSEDVAFADFDVDGDLDLVFVSEDDSKDELYLNDGTGRFADVSERLVPDDVSNGLVVLDLNGDGAPDVLTGNIGIDRALVNDGSRPVPRRDGDRWRQGGAESRTQDLEAFDADGDGDLDVAVANEGQNQLYLNASGVLVDVTEMNLPRENDESREIRAADFDTDGDLDLVVANVRFVFDEPEGDTLLLNDGKGVFTPAPAGWLPAAGDRSNFTIQAHDLDGDADIDVVAPSTVFGLRPAITACCSTTARRVSRWPARLRCCRPRPKATASTSRLPTSTPTGAPIYSSATALRCGEDPRRVGRGAALAARRS